MNTVKPESTASFCLTPGGVVLMEYLIAMLSVTCFTSRKLLGKGLTPFENGFASATHRAFTSYPVPIFIGATGTAVRVLAPLINDKFYDPAMVVVDERAQRITGLLSGHVGDASVLVRHLANMLGADPVITTVTDVNDMVALGTLAFQLDAQMSDFRSVVKIVNQMLVGNKRVDLWWDDKLMQDVSRCDRREFIMATDLSQLPELDVSVCITSRTNLPDLLTPHWRLMPQQVITGTSCRRNTPFPLLAALLTRQFEAQRLDPLVLKAIGSISLKRDEQGPIQLASYCHISFEVLTADASREHEHRFLASPFARETMGIGSVSGPAARLLNHGKLLGETLRGQGVTITSGVSH